ncbi:MAG: undecaprenyl-diphosphate phosphatase [Candidatus Micrarchaeota archaeon]
MAIDLIQAILLGVLQGITEWLPISSSAHLALAQILLKMDVPVVFDVMLHLGTLIAAIAFMREEIWRIIIATLKFDRKSGDFKVAMLIILATIPTAIIGFAFRGFFEQQFANAVSIGVALIITGIFLYYCDVGGKRGLDKKSAFVIGVAQGIAVMPGISRSGATIGTGLLMGIGREKAARFSFLLSIPAIIGAAAFEIKDAQLDFSGLDTMAIGIGVSAITGYLAIGFLIDFVNKRGLRPFAYYCFAAGLLALTAGWMAK